MVGITNGNPDCTSTFVSERTLFKMKNSISMSQVDLNVNYFYVFQTKFILLYLADTEYLQCNMQHSSGGSCQSVPEFKLFPLFCWPAEEKS